MPLPEDYLKYDNRKKGMDHSLYKWSNLFDRPSIKWPNDKSICLWITVALEYFPLSPNDGPFRAPGHMVTPYPDYRSYTTRDYGNRVGIFRIMKVLDELELKASTPMSSVIADRYPTLLDEVVSRNWEIIGHGLDMNKIHYGCMDLGQEKKQVKDALSRLRDKGHPVRGWYSPARSESKNTLAILAQNNIEYVCDWVNDDMPYRMTSDAGSLVAMPHTMELEDRHLMVDLGQNEATYEQQVLASFNLLQNEAQSHGGRLLHLSLTPYIIGQPFRIHILKSVLDKMMKSGDVWNATGSEIMDCWAPQQK